MTVGTGETGDQAETGRRAMQSRRAMVLVLGGLALALVVVSMVIIRPRGGATPAAGRTGTRPAADPGNGGHHAGAATNPDKKPLPSAAIAGVDLDTVRQQAAAQLGVKLVQLTGLYAGATHDQATSADLHVSILPGGPGGRRVYSLSCRFLKDDITVSATLLDRAEQCARLGTPEADRTSVSSFITSDGVKAAPGTPRQLDVSGLHATIFHTKTLFEIDVSAS